ncbi:5-oxoprolinase subunit PxpA [Salimicrobium sp. PL1-032A]|uniref:5-oxoprolinase subunit PxpA n=1 Tax=Salimicrobium sp. PL1-032A TaxID=3095364 RepID=UPI0032612BB4
MTTIDLNCDLGESFGVYNLGNDEKVLEEITSANIACGYHAGDPNVMEQTVKIAKDKNVAVGAHPGLPDLMGFGRRTMQVDPEEVYNLTVYQIHALQGFCQIHDTRMQHVKAHGALYNMAAKRPEIAEAIAGAVRDTDPRLILFGLAGSELITAGKKAGLKLAQEVFADRTYQPDGTLTPRSEENAMIHDPEEAITQVKRMVTEGTCSAVDGSTIRMHADTICVHGDNPEALKFTRHLKEELKAEGIKVGCFL